MSVGILLLVLVLFIIPAAVTVLALVDLLRYDKVTWERSGENQLVWALAIIFVALIGPVVYLAIGRPKLQAAAAAAVDSIGPVPV